MSGSKIIFTSSNVLLCGSDSCSPATIVADKTTGNVIEIRESRSARSDFPNISENDWIDVGDKWILPGLVDSHVHLNDPGRTEWEGFYTGTLAASAGGVTTIVDMPLNSSPTTTTKGNLAIKRNAAQGQCWTDVAFWGGLIPGNEHELKMMLEEGAKGFKCFMIDSGMDDFPCIQAENIEKAMQELQGTETVLLFHAELETDHAHAEAKPGADPKRYETYLDSRPQKLETDAIELVINLQKKYPSVRCHIVHLSAASALPSIRAAKAAGARLTIETCFHYLTLASSTIPDAAPQYKCCPPIRDSANREALWEALLDGTIDCVVSDHSPCLPEFKRLEEGDLMRAWGGINSLGLGLSLLWTEGKKHGASIGQIIQWTSATTAKIASLHDRKGAIKVGYDADLVIWNPQAEFKVSKDEMHFKNKLSPYEGMTVQGKVEKTFVRGQLSWDANRKGVGLRPVGQPV